MDKNFTEVRNLINGNNKIVLTTHLLPDGDAIGSELALYYYLLQKGKEVSIINHNESPDHLEFLDEDKIIRRYRDNKTENDKIISEANLIFIVDTNEYARIKTMEDSVKKSKAKKICIDHHTGIDKNGFDNYITDTEAPATSEILYDFIISDDEKYINKKTADNLYAGIMTDTGSFRYPRTTKKTFLICADLIDRGTDPVAMYDKIYNNIPQDKIKLLARFIDSLSFHFGKTLVVGIVTMNDFKEFHSDIKDVEGFSAFLMTMKNINAGFLIVELPDSCKISFRSKGDIKINEFAKKYGGGGHKNAAGATVENTDILELKDKLIKDYESFFKITEKSGMDSD
ncbi:MAG: bifunctional oligoribonuclease/PAP phosphatase NrnA [Ignavibacteria bacterium]|nr:bifunctional oligoribonuclease/PAP phosphatase NrnA [Ignavibacteria bacterium]